MTYNIVLASRAEREAQIKKSLLSSIGTEDFYDFRNTKYTLKVIRIGIALPVYRMENFRTFTDQKEFIVSNKKDKDFFVKGQETESVQQQQHELLAKLAKKGVSDSIIPVIDVLRKEKQREPLLISSSGVVVNGNRRLAAMRELYAEDPSAYSEFSHVNCMVLPEDATADEIVDVEASLQAKPETKLDYDWIGDAQLINRLLNMGRTPAQVADKLNRGEREIKNSIQALAEAELYLKDWAHAEGEYNKIKEDAEQLFKDLPKRLEGKDARLQDASRAIAWSLFENRDRLDRRVYDFNAAFGKLAADVLDRVADDLGLCDAGYSSSGGIEDNDFSVDIGAEDDSSSSYDAVIEALRDEATKDEAVDVLIEACQSAIETEKGQKSGEAALKAVSQAHSKLVSVDLSKASPQTYAGIRKQLEAIQGLANKLMGKLDEYERQA